MREGNLLLARNRGVSPHVIREMERLVFQHADLLLENYHGYHKR
jgi:hypothetical protein